MKDSVWEMLTSLIVYFSSVFLLPLMIVRLVNNPHDYWNWFGVVIWTYLLLSTMMDTYVRVPIVKAIREEK